MIPRARVKTGIKPTAIATMRPGIGGLLCDYSRHTVAEMCDGVLTISS